MTRFHFVRSGVCVAALFAANGALADVTAQEVWDEWKESLDLYGEGAVTIGSEQNVGGALVVDGITMALYQPDGSTEAEIGPLTFTENGDGTVSVEMPETSTIVFSPDDMISDRDRATIDVTISGATMVVSGTAEDMVFDLSAARYELSLAEILADGEVVPGDASITMNDLSGTYSLRGDSLKEVDYDLTTASVDVLVDFDIPDEVLLLISGQMQDLSLSASGALPESLADMNPDNPMQMFADGFAIAANYSVGPISFLMNFAERNDTFTGTFGADGAELSMAIDSQALAYSTLTNGLSVNFQGSEIPFPVELSAAQYGLGLSMPLAATEEPTDFSAYLALVDLSVNDMIWMMADPAGNLPHDPATAVIRLSGTGKLLYDLTTQEGQMGAAMSDMPGEIHSLSLDELNVDVVGAQLTGDGSFTFDNSDLSTFPGVPRPNGSASVQLTGGNALIDKLTAMGLVSEEDVMGARMMMGMFATVTGDDQLETTLEVNDQGHLIVNGQRLQ